jgi:DNA-binding transcriptional regulator LsrR (DeoR family)
MRVASPALWWVPGEPVHRHKISSPVKHPLTNLIEHGNLIALSLGFNCTPFVKQLHESHSEDMDLMMLCGRGTPESYYYKV